MKGVALNSKILNKMTGPKGKTISLFATRVLIYFATTALALNPDWFNALNLFVYVAIFAMLLILFLAPYLGYALKLRKREGKDQENELKLVIPLVLELFLSPLLITTVLLTFQSYVNKLILVTIIYGLTLIIENQLNKKLP